MILIFSCFLPMINFITIPLLTVAVIYLYVKLDLKRFLLVYLANILIMILIGGKIAFLLLSLPLFFLPAAIVMGFLYKKSFTAYKAIIASGLILVAEMIVLLIGMKLSGYDPFNYLKDNFNQMITLLPEGTIEPAAVESFFYMFQLISPFLMLFIGASYAFTSHALSRLILPRMGESIPKLPSIQKLRLPRTTVIYFILVMLLSMFVDEQSGSILAMVAYNILPVLTILLTLQALSLLFFVVHHFKWNRGIPWIAIVIVLFWSGWLYITVFVGMLDILFPLRARLTDKS
ncbi:MAG: DUF2232 domain-containing protein [Gorillibacterium sp.]|nr:DUF2232 domain-containing protein [Gorillibacterium sp.]